MNEFNLGVLEQRDQPVFLQPPLPPMPSAEETAAAAAMGATSAWDGSGAAQAGECRVKMEERVKGGGYSPPTQNNHVNNV